MRDPACPKCREYGKPQMYSVEGELGLYVFDVERARQIIAEHRALTGSDRRAHLVEPALVAQMLAVNVEHTPEHIDHVDPREPGIIAQRFGGYALIDGNHRARRCLRDGLPFYVYALTYPESEACEVVKQPVAAMSPEMVAREITGFIKNNPQCETLTATLTYTADEDPATVERVLREILSDLREILSDEVNARVRFKLERRA